MTKHLLPTGDCLQKKIRLLLLLIIAGLIVSGLTAFPIKAQLEISHTYIEQYNWNNALTNWLELVYTGIQETDSRYPFIAYGTDWLGFAHLIIAVAFIGPFREPVRNIWVVQFGIIACASIIPFAWIAGEVRGIPYFWRLIDCSFGVVGGLLLWQCQRLIKKLASMTAQTISNIQSS
ncbi:MAG: hypothetical protein J0L67_14985 [Cytophagales bacterium]|nr:hypothetical protein [Cytophagales bacterium]